MPRRVLRSARSFPRSVPASETWPASTGISPVMALSSVLLPAPLGPTMATTCTASGRDRDSANEVGIEHLPARSELSHRAGGNGAALRHHDHPVAQSLDNGQ